MNSQFRQLVGTSSVDAATTHNFDLGVDSYKYRFVLSAIHADGTPAPVRVLHTPTLAGNAAGTDQITAERGSYYFTPRRDGNLVEQYLKIYGISNQTLLSVSKLVG